MNKLVASVALGMVAGYVLCKKTPCIKKMLTKGKRKVREMLD